MTTKRNGKPMPTTPHELCTRLTELGDSFWIECLNCSKPEPLDVRCHGPEWVEICRPGEGQTYFWTRWENLAPFRIVEG